MKLPFKRKRDGIPQNGLVAEYRFDEIGQRLYDSEINAVTPAEGADGRCVVSHIFNEEDRTWLEAYTATLTGVQVLDALPEDWVYPNDL